LRAALPQEKENVDDVVANVLAHSKRAQEMRAKAADLDAVGIGAPQAGGSRGLFDPFDPFEHLLSSFHTILRVRFGGHLPSSPLF
jgi:hypothetical protein